MIIPHGCVVLDHGWELRALWPATWLKVLLNVPALAGKKPVLEYVTFGYKWVVPKVCGLVTWPRGPLRSASSFSEPCKVVSFPI